MGITGRYGISIKDRFNWQLAALQVLVLLLTLYAPLELTRLMVISPYYRWWSVEHLFEISFIWIGYSAAMLIVAGSLRRIDRISNGK